MKIRPAALLLVLASGLGAALPGQKATQDPDPGRITSTLIDSASGQLVLAQEFVVQAPVSKVWEAFVTEEGWTSWASPHAKIDLRPGGTFRTHYGEDAEVGDPGTITLHVVNYVPERVLTLRAEMAEHFPEVMQEDDGNLMSVTLFEPLDEERTRVVAYGVGYRDLPEYKELMEYFRPANEGLYRVLVTHLEK